jgi:hypothetical protein
MTLDVVIIYGEKCSRCKYISDGISRYSPGKHDIYSLIALNQSQKVNMMTTKIGWGL